MKIALFHNLQSAGGAKRVLYEHAIRLRERGHILDTYLISTAHETFLPLEPLSRHTRVYTYDAPTEPSLNLQMRRASRYAAGLLLGRSAREYLYEAHQVQAHLRQLAALEAVYRKMAADIDQEGYDAVYTHQCNFMLAPDLHRFLKCPSVFYCQDSLREAYEWAVTTPADYDDRPETTYLRKRRGRWMTRTTLDLWEKKEAQYIANTRAATSVLCNSWYSREAILRTTGVDLTLCPLGIDATYYSPEPTIPREKEVLSVGAITPLKCHDFVLEAVGTIPIARRPRLRIIGYEMLHAEAIGPKLEKRAAELEVSLTIDREVTDDAVRAAYRRCGVVAFAPYLEPFGLVPLEAGGCGAPVVGVAEAGIRETITDGVNGLLAPRDPQAFGSALDHILSDKKLAERLASAGREAAVTEWTWERSVDTLEAALSKVQPKV